MFGYNERRAARVGPGDSQGDRISSRSTPNYSRSTMTMIARNGIIQAVNDEVEFYTIEATGESGMSLSGLGRLCGVNRQAIEQLKNRLSTSSCPEFLKPLQGIDLTLVSSVNEFNNATILNSGTCVMFLEWYAFESQRTNDTARFSYRKFSRIGINAWIQDITGWQAKPQATPDTPHIARLKEKARHIISNHLWAPFFECYPVYEYLEQELGFVFSYYDLIDGSIGRRYSIFRQDKPWWLPAESYTHNFDDQRGSRTCAAYRYAELPYFKDWLEQEYIPTEMPAYLVNKFGKLAVKEVYEQHGILTDDVAKLVAGKVTPKQQRLYTEWQEKKRFALQPTNSTLTLNLYTA